jgi:hypothetical protein
MAAQQLIHEYGSEFDWKSNSEFNNNNFKHSYFQGMDCFRSGRDALKGIALKYRSRYKRVLLPALCCDSMVQPFEVNDYDISYFKLNDDISADFEDILTKIESDTIFLYINYFGISTLSDLQLNLIQEKSPKTIMIEDRTHDIFMQRNRKFIPNYTVCSIRKWIAIPDGGILYSHYKQNDFQKRKDTYFGDIRTIALKMKSEYIKTGDIQIKTLFRKKLAEANFYLDMDEAVADMSQESYKLLRYIDFEKISKYRYENTQELSKQLINISGVKSILSGLEQGGLYYPILVDNRDIIQRALAERNIYCPVIWPLPKGAKDICEVSENISKSMIALPCDHRYRKSDMKHICNVLREILGC